MLLRIANREDPDQTAQSGPFGQASSMRNYRTFTVIKFIAQVKQQKKHLLALSR